MEGADASAPAQGDSGLTTTASMPIAPVYAGSVGRYNPYAPARSRKKAFEQYKTSVSAGGRF